MGRSSNQKWKKRKVTTGLNKQKWQKFIKVKHVTTQKIAREVKAQVDKEVNG